MGTQIKDFAGDIDQRPDESDGWNAPSSDFSRALNPITPAESHRPPAPASWAPEWLGRINDELREVKLSFDEPSQTLWATMIPPGRPCFTSQLVSDFIHLYGRLRELFAQHEPAKPIRYIAYKSSVPGIFSLGGDLELFARSISNRDAQTLRRYAHACARMTYENAHGAGGLPIVTIALVHGQALGGGFESAMSCDVMIAERSAVFGLPEVLFNLFPGMGAYSYLSRRVGNVAAERLILSGKTYTADELHELGVVDLVVEDGTGVEAVQDYIERNGRRHNAHAAVYRTRRRVTPLTYDELKDVTDIWVDCAMGLTELDLRKMGKLTSAQDRLRRAIV